MAFSKPAPSLLEDAGYSAGDYIPVISMGNLGVYSYSTTSTTYESNVNQAAWYYGTWNQYFPADVTPVVWAQLGHTQGSGETMDVRIQETAQGDTLFEQLDAGYGLERWGPTTYEPGDRSFRLGFRPQLRTNPGTESSEIYSTFVQVGYQL